MARGPEIPDFPAKISLLLDRLNWSRARLAQRAGVDKSIAQRWVAGRVQPGEASLAALTATIGEAVPGFTRADWRLPLPAFGARFAPAAEGPVDPVRSMLPHLTGAAPNTAASAAQYRGFWLLLHASVQAPEQLGIVGYLASIAPRDGVLQLAAQGGVLGTWRAAGPLFPMRRLVYMILEEDAPGSSVAFGVLNGSLLGKAMVMDGIGSSSASSLRGPAAATRLMGLRLDDEPEPAWQGEALRRLTRQNDRGLAEALPTSLRGQFQMAPAASPRAMVMTVGAGQSLACDAEEIAQGLAPEAAEAIAAARAICGR